MGVIDDVKSTSIFAKIVLICLFVANLFNGIAFTTTSWGEEYAVNAVTGVRDITTSITHYGLWRTCQLSDFADALLSPGTCADAFTGTASDWVAAVQAMSCFGFGGIIGAFILVLVYVLKSKNSDHALVAGIICIVTGVLYLIGLIIFGINFHRVLLTPFTERDLSWSYGLAIVSMLLEIVSGVLLILDAKKGSSTSPA